MPVPDFRSSMLPALRALSADRRAGGGSCRAARHPWREAALAFALAWPGLSPALAGAPDPARPLPAVVTVEAPSRDLPPEIAGMEIEVNELGPLPLAELVGRVADLAGVRASIEERPGRVLDGDVVARPAVPFGLSMTGPVPAVLDEIARLSGYGWGWEDGRLVFHRYRDVEQARAARLPGGVPVDLLAAVLEGQAAAGAEASAGRADGTSAAAAARAGWAVDPEAHGTVEGVLRAWADRAGWRVDWRSERAFTVGAAAAFDAGETGEAGFLAAADALLAIPPMRRALSATAYPNRWLVVRDAGSAAP